MASLEGNTTKKPITRRRKIEIKKVEEVNKRHVTFSKRKLGLFNKVTELSILCQAETALIVTSPNGKLYSCGYPKPDTVIQRFLTKGPPVYIGEKRQQEETVETLRLQYESIQDQLKEEKKNLQQIIEAHKSSSCFPSWWNLSIEDMNLECLEHFMESMKLLRLNLVAAIQEKTFHSLAPLPLSVVPPPTLSNLPFIGGQQLQNWNTVGSSSTPTFMLPHFGHY